MEWAVIVSFFIIAGLFPWQVEGVAKNLNRHKNDTTHFKAAAFYIDIDGLGGTGLHLIVGLDDLPFEVIDTWLKHAPETARQENE